MKRTVLLGAASAFVLSMVAFTPMTAHAKQGFGTETTSTQGSGGKTNTSTNPDNQGQTTTTTTGPSGALKNDKSTPNQTTSTSLPGKSR